MKCRTLIALFVATYAALAGPASALADASVTTSEVEATSCPVCCHSDRQLIGGNRFFATLGLLTGSQFIHGAVALDGGLVLGVGVALTYNGEALANNSQHAVAAEILLEGQYMVVNDASFAMGPELQVAVPVAPQAADVISLRPGWVMWAAPWRSPVALGFSWQAAITVPTAVRGKAAVRLGTGSLRLAYLF